MSTVTPTKNLLDLSGRVAVVTGGTRGIGEAIVRQLAAAGARVVAVSRSALASPARSVRDGEVTTLTADIAKKSEVDGMVETVVARHGTVDILVNCAGTAKRAPALEQAETDWEYMIELNLRGTAWACRAVAPVMRRAGRGRIVNITSIGAEFGLVNRAAYCATKGAVAQLTRCLALEWGPYGITVNAVGPGITVTPLVRPFLDANPGKEETMTRKIPLGRLGRPDDMAGAVVFLASDLAEYVTGQTIFVDGGWGVGDLDW
ncbi:MAG TPA: SDR family NAD(P)-dependent oxidoreductase [Methylomirabilota bacterium]|nr:SDR family NAD(P)-dependent oxidoreductase [Methylomirabilota bacterium]